MAAEYRRFPAARRKIASVDPEKDVRVRVLGTVIETIDNGFVIDDGTGSAPVESQEKISIGNQVMAFCRVVPAGDGFRLIGEIVQDMSLLDRTLYDKVFSV